MSKNKKPYLDQEAVMIPVSEATQIKVANMKDGDTIVASSTGSGFMRDLNAWKGKKFVAPTNVLHLSSETRNRKHPAVYPVELPLFFIKLLSRTNDLIVDPFAGSGSTGIAAIRSGRNCILIDNKYEYCLVAKERMERDCGMILSHKNQDCYDANNSIRSIAKASLEPLNSFCI